MKQLVRLIAFFVLSLGMAGFASATTLEKVKARGKLLCGVNTGLQGFAAPDASGVWAGFDVDFCRAVAAAVLSDAGKVEFVPLTAQNRFEKLAAGEVDLLARNTTWTMERETKYPFRFVRRQLYGRSGLHGAEGARRYDGHDHEPGSDLLSLRHHDAGECRRLLP